MVVMILELAVVVMITRLIVMNTSERYPFVFIFPHLRCHI